MKPKTLPCIALIVLGTLSVASAASGIFGTGTVLGVNGTKTLYATTLLNDSRHAPINVTPPTLDLDGIPSSVGTFNPTVGDTLVLRGGEMLTFKNGTDDITGATIHYRIDGGSFQTFNLSFNENLNGSDQRWYGEGANVNLLTGLSNGNHTLQVFYTAPFTFTGGSGTHTINNGTANYSFNFTVVPEPATALLGSFGLLALLRRRK
ncbi:PEP-CTERM sorting domain-containing protein [Luteolibacter arcticus]|uniref:PEP-CTERM sorting domain-containing protein n=1 Tax=Luteolibacter arcticus TaxID=1581411 RepID=A0ABT3GG55_9BACT|nr:PEP-CTERM sorting domain-containing protein [Luteolibacter arcticus]MCW1922590.1 PEP-CTERM sorting domain-containing protein [Luteolibacter arcticus]